MTPTDTSQPSPPIQQPPDSPTPTPQHHSNTAKLGFESPYFSTPETDIIRIQCNVSQTDHTFVKLIHPGHGTIRSVLGILWHKFCTALRDNQITDHSKQNEFKHFISNSVLVDRDELASLTNDATQWRQFQVSRGNLAESSNSGPDGASGSAVSKTGGRNVRKRAA